MILRFASRITLNWLKHYHFNTLWEVFWDVIKIIPKEDFSQTCKGITSDKLLEPFDPASGKTKRELQSFAYLTIFKDIISSIELLQ